MKKNETYPNQRTINTHKAESNGKREECKYAIMNLIASELALSILKPNTFKLWFYINKNQDNYKFSLSSKDVMRACKMNSWDTYRKAFEELTEKSYLVETSENQFEFYELPSREDAVDVRVNKAHRIIGDLVEWQDSLD